MKPENQFISNLHKHLDVRIHREKTANPYRRGMPDVYYEAPGKILWAEYKWFEKETVRPVDLTKHLTSKQQEWLTRAHDNGLATAVVLGCPMRAAILFGDAWCHPQLIDWQSRRAVKRSIENALLPGGTDAPDNQRIDDPTT